MQLDTNSKKRPVYKNIGLLDSFRIMPSSLDSLAKNLPSEDMECKLLEQHFNRWPESAVDKLKRKGFFPHGYIENFDKLAESELPPHSVRTNSLRQLEVTEKKYEHAVDVFKIFQCGSIG